MPGPRTRRSIGAALLALAPAAGLAEPTYVDEAIEVLDWGIICSEGEVIREAAPDTDLGFVTRPRGIVEIVRTTRYVALEQWGMFGVEARALQSGFEDVEIRVTPPPFPDTGTTEQNWTTGFCTAAPTINYFRFDHETEMVPGIWAFEARRDARVLFRVEFRLRGEGLAPGAWDTCEGSDQAGLTACGGT